ncbi:uncharacterized protein LAESUDRAFT_641403 [Laetiporus sulphureus 93-53]|uniref:Uncharacterized protein n=1 Tax=Laetiporus sulphureus 93-53 TaxID=1314785 RepID=A0A165HKN4_9APHY|nr:uncharacterized protein LAESUDRAFT_641403 [Laetiporus sulphureus 93-53]KZT11855.1 hypothetical protein LAESUDRAFT_641403 [Laetiporus sulphureus 93-53]
MAVPPAWFALPQYTLPVLLAQPAGTYGISYDISTGPTEQDPPMGWGAPRDAFLIIVHYQVKTYRRLIARLHANHFQRHQYSDYVHHNTSAMYTYLTMVRLRFIAPTMKLAMTVKSMKMHHIAAMHVFDQTHELQLGGFYAPILTGPTPHGLVLPALPLLAIPPAPIPVGAFVRPVDTASSLAANNPGNNLM